MWIKGTIGAHRLIRNERQDHSRHRGKLQGSTDILHRDATGEAVEHRLERKQYHHADRQHQSHAFLTPEDQPPDQEGDHSGGSRRETWITPSACPTLEKESQPQSHGAKPRDKKEGVHRLRKPGAERPEERPEGEGAEACQHPVAMMAKLLVPLTLQPDQRTERPADQKTQKEVVGIRMGHTERMNPYSRPMKAERIWLFVPSDFPISGFSPRFFLLQPAEDIEVR